MGTLSFVSVNYQQGKRSTDKAIHIKVKMRICVLVSYSNPLGEIIF